MKTKSAPLLILCVLLIGLIAIGSTDTTTGYSGSCATNCVTAITQGLHTFINSIGLVNTTNIGWDFNNGANTISAVLSNVATSVSNTDGTLTISPTSGSVIASLNLGHPNTWTGLQTFSNTQGILLSNSNAGLGNSEGFGNGLQLVNTNGGNSRMRLDIIPSGTPSSGTESSSLCLWNDASLSASLCLQIFQGNSIQIGGSGAALPIIFNMAGLACVSIMHILTTGAVTFGCSTTTFEVSTTGLANTQGFQSFTCSLATVSTSDVCNLAITEPNTTYTAICSMESNGGTTSYGIEVSNTSTTQITLTYVAIGASGGQADCLVTHQ